MKTKFIELRVYRMSETLADKVWGIVLGWNNLATDTVGKQLIRPLIRSGRISPKARVEERLRTIRGSFASPEAQETQHWLRRAYKRKLFSAGQIEELKPLIDQLGPSLNAYLSKIGTSKDQKPKTKNQEQ